MYNNQTKSDISLELALSMDLDKYINLVWKGPGKKYVDKYWTLPTKTDKQNFKVWRSASLLRQKELFEVSKGNNIMSLEYLKINEKRKIISLLSMERYFSIYHSMISGILVDKYHALAIICGIIDHAKIALFAGEAKPLVINVKKQKAIPILSYKEIGMLCWFMNIDTDSKKGVELLDKFGGGKTNSGSLKKKYIEIAGKGYEEFDTDKVFLKYKLLLRLGKGLGGGGVRKANVEGLEKVIKILTGSPKIAAENMLILVEKEIKEKGY